MRALEVAAAGAHQLLLTGPPGVRPKPCMREGIRAVADLPSNMRATFIEGSSACPSPPSCCPGPPWTTGSRERRPRGGDEGQQAKPSHRGLRGELHRQGRVSYLR
ncbi:ATP-binding protein [Pseudarthrobacter raffinosi]|uniref:ATP-binding protein n=1 Tax=Pseudarthrobacter raffinosi TaxID=2953651 RepID=UPI0035AC2014